jgi:hypothetical protein
MSALIEVKEGGKRRSVSKQRVATRQLVNKAATGDLKAYALLAEMLRKTGQLANEPPAEVPALDQRDLRAFDRFAALFAGAQVADGGRPDAETAEAMESNSGTSPEGQNLHQE